jgi:hypothetical protein
MSANSLKKLPQLLVNSTSEKRNLRRCTQTAGRIRILKKKGEVQGMRRATGLWLILVALVLSCGARITYAQEENKPAPEDNKAKTENRTSSAQQGVPGGAEKPVHPYRAEFLITELEEGKKVNARHYSMLLNAGGWNKIQIGTKVPVPTGSSVPGQSQFEYLDVGTSIDCRLIESGDDLAIDVRSEFSNLSGPEEQHSPQPFIRQVSLHGNTLVVSGKPVVIGVVDDPSSHRQFQLEATVTKLK